MNYPCLWPPAKDWSSSGGLFFLNLPLPHTGAPRPFSSPFSLCLARCPGVSYTCGQASTPPWPLSKAETLFRAQWSCRYSGQPLAQPHEMAASTLLGPRLSHCLNQSTTQFGLAELTFSLFQMRLLLSVPLRQPSDSCQSIPRHSESSQCLRS